MTVSGRVSVGHPVDVATGVLFHEVDDFVQPGRMSLAFRRRYSSRLIHRSDGMFGMGWSSPWEMRIREDLEGFRLVIEDGETEILFDRAGIAAGRDASPNLGSFHELAVESGSLVVTRWAPDGGEVVRYFFPRPKGEEWVHLTSRQLPDGEGIDVEREATGRIKILRQRREKRGYRLAYDDEGHVVEVFLFARVPEVVAGVPEIRTSERSILRYTYENGRLTQCTDPVGHRTAYVYDTKGRKLREVLRSGASWTFVHDDQDRCVRASGPDQYDDRSFRYGEGFTEVTDSRNGTWTYHWNDLGQVEVAVSPQGFATRSAFDEYGRIVQRIDPNGNGYRFEYDNDGNRSSIVDPAGGVTRFEFASDRQIRRMVDRAGQPWEREYDEHHRLVSIRDPVGGNWSFAWNGYGDLESFRPPGEGTRTFRYDGNGNVVEQIDAMGNAYRYQYDDFGNWIESIDPLGNRTQRRFSPRREVIEVTWPDGSLTKNEYDASGVLRRTVDPTGRTTTYRTAGCTGEPTTIDRGGSLWQFRWGTEPQQLREVQNPNGESWRFEYDPDGRLMQEESYDGQRTTYSYDPAGRLATRERAGQVTEYNWNAVGLLASVRHSDGSSVSYRYDDLGRLVAVEDPSGSIKFVRDAYGRATKETFGDFSVEREFSRAGRLVRQSTSRGDRTEYRYDPNGRVLDVLVQGRAVHLERDARGRIVRYVLPEGGQIGQKFDASGRLREQTVTVSGSSGSGGLVRSYEYDAAGRLSSSQDSRWGGGDYEYDGQGRLATFRRSDGGIAQYSYDPAGNITSTRRVAASRRESAESYETRDLAPGGRVLRQGDTRYEYDELGRTVRRIIAVAGSERVWEYAWDSRDRLTSVTDPDGAVWRYDYDAFGRRIRKTGPKSAVSYFWSGDRIVNEIEESGELRSWDYLPYRPFPFSKTENSRTYYCVGDTIGTPRELLTARGSLAWAGLPSPWGDLDKEEAVETTCSARLPGQWADAESGLSYNRFRYYAPWRMQYLSQDPLRSVQSPGPYAYPTDPVQVIDPLGLLAEVLYGDPDGLGRPTGATAVITPADISTGTEANSTIRPPGFEGGNHPFHHERGHLIGNQLGGDGNDPRNLVTLTGGTNHPHMESLEAQVRAHVEAGNFVEVRVTPIYEGDQLVPSRVKYEATDLATGNKIVDTEVENGQHKNYKACQH